MLLIGCSRRRILPFFAAITYSIFFFNDTATTEIYTLSLHDALPICRTGRADFPHPALLKTLVTGSRIRSPGVGAQVAGSVGNTWCLPGDEKPAGCAGSDVGRSEEHTSELQSHSDLVCRLLLEIKKRLLLTIVLLRFLSLMLASVLVLMLPLLVWLTPDLRIKKSLLKCNWTIRKRLPRCKMRLKKRLLAFSLLLLARLRPTSSLHHLTSLFFFFWNIPRPTYIYSFTPHAPFRF